jgi:hypothetical protein
MSNRLSIVQALIYGCFTAWFALLAAPAFFGSTTLHLALCVILIGLSIAALVMIARGDASLESRTAMRSAARRPTATVVGIAFLFAALVVSASYVALRDWESDGLWTFALMFFGLPWSHTQYFLTAYPVSLVNPDILTSTLLLPMAVNVALATILIVSTRFRARATNWFFGLGERPGLGADELAEDEITMKEGPSPQ